MGQSDEKRKITGREKRKNVLRRRLWRNLKEEPGKYLVIFLLLTFTIGFISGDNVAGNSMARSLRESPQVYTTEWGHFRVQNVLNEAQREAVCSHGITIYENFYYDLSLTNGNTLRVFRNRDEVNFACLMEGRLPERCGEIAIDRMHADNNGISVGDTLSTSDRTWTITGLISLPDYQSLFSDNSDSMFDAILFGTAVVCSEEFNQLSGSPMQIVYSWLYDSPPADDAEEKVMADDLMDALSEDIVLKDFLPRYENQAICYAVDDIEGDTGMMVVFLYLVIIIMAFVFALTASDTIARDASVIGTLRASGYSRGEIIRHYMALPVLVTLFSALVGNVTGYTFWVNFAADMYYNSYSLPTFVIYWNADAFVNTTIVPILLMAAINWVILASKLRLSPLRFLRHNLGRARRHGAFPLPRLLPFLTRFRLRIFGQNLGSYLTVFIGVLFANLLLSWGLILPQALEDYEADISEKLLAQYQTILEIPVELQSGDSDLDSLLGTVKFMRGVETENPTAEKFSAYTLKTNWEQFTAEDIMIYGVEPDSRYVSLSSEDEILVSQGFADKYGISPGDTLVLKEPYEDKTYSFQITGSYDYPGALCVFMSRSHLNALLDWDEEMFAGYFSDTPITDIDSDYIGSVIDYTSITKISRQLDHSMGDLMYMLDGFSVAIFIVVIYLLTKIIIEKNSQSISMVKILGYTPGEIGRLYVVATSIVVLLSMALTAKWMVDVMKPIFRYMFLYMMTGWIPISPRPSLFWMVFGIGAASYAVVAVLEFVKIGRIPKTDALKNSE